MNLYGAPGWGSAISEIMLTMTGEPYQFINVEGFDEPGPQRDRLQALNPLCQVPTLELDDGQILTESAAIALWLLDRHPQFAPEPGTPERQQFWRLLIWLVANVYPTFTYGDYPARWVTDNPQALTDSTNRYRESLWRWLETQLHHAPYTFGERLTLIDAWWPVIRLWRPRAEWFTAETPGLNALADRVCERPELQDVLRANKLLS
ncbi:glutathione S-transferase family protein [Atlantibacter hermannii]|uniref:glutathione S-transferase family protein n=1 Tax=Atlantibacter hermannii TaxID=565 RepID=UPI0020748623|nr:glutathione S-transferase [Atlantibacter hermannii]